MSENEEIPEINPFFRGTMIALLFSFNLYLWIYLGVKYVLR